MLLISDGFARMQHQGHDENEQETLEGQALRDSEAVNRWMLMRRDLLNITIDTDKIDEQPLTAEDLLLRMQLMAYVQKLVDKQEKKKAKEAKKAEKAQAKAALLGLPPAYWGPPPPVTVSPPLPIPTSVNLSGSEPLPPPGFWLYKKAAFLTKLFSALADAAATLPGVTTEPPQDDTDEDDADADAIEENTDASIVNVNDEGKRSVEDSDEYGGDVYDERVYVEGPATKMIKSSRRKQPSRKHGGASKKYNGHVNHIFILKGQNLYECKTSFSFL